MSLRERRVVFIGANTLDMDFLFKLLLSVLSSMNLKNPLFIITASTHTHFKKLPCSKQSERNSSCPWDFLVLIWNSAPRNRIVKLKIHFMMPLGENVLRILECNLKGSLKINDQHMVPSVLYKHIHTHTLKHYDYTQNK